MDWAQLGYCTLGNTEYHFVRIPPPGKTSEGETYALGPIHSRTVVMSVHWLSSD